MVDGRSVDRVTYPPPGRSIPTRRERIVHRVAGPACPNAFRRPRLGLASSHRVQGGKRGGQVSVDDQARGSSDPSLAAVEFDELLREVLGRVHGVLDESERLRHLLDAVVAVSSELSLDAVLARIVSAASNLLGARYAALGVLTEARSAGCGPSSTHGMADEVVEQIGALPTGHGLLGLLIDDRARSGSRTSRRTGVYGFPAEHPRCRPSRGAGPHARPGLRQPLPHREVGWRGLHETDESIAEALAAAAGSRSRTPPLRGVRGPTRLAGRDGRDRGAAERGHAGRRGAAGRRRPGAVAVARRRGVGGDGLHGGASCASRWSRVRPVDLEAMRALPMRARWRAS